MAVTLTSNFFDELGMKYEEAFGHNPGLIEFIKLSLALLPEHASVLDVGCGTGKPTCGMIADSGRQIHGIDNSATMIALSRKQVPGGFFEEISMFDFQPKAPFDAVFATFSFFNLANELGPLMKRINNWIVPNGYFFIGTMAVDDFEAESTVIDKDPSAKYISAKFMGITASTLLYTKQGYRSLLHQAGFDILKTATVPFQAPEEAMCDLEPHYYITARKVTTIEIL